MKFERFAKIIAEEFKPDRAPAPYSYRTVGGVKTVIIKKKNVNPEMVSNSDLTVVINQEDLTDAKSSFCDFNPDIRAFAASGPDEMFFVMGLVIGTIGTSWAQFRDIYPVYAAYIKETDGEDIRIDTIVGLSGKSISVKKWVHRQAPKYLRALWKQRKYLYEKIFNERLIDKEYELYMFLNYTVMGLSTVKAAFAVQMLAGKLGCIDNINADVYGIPVEISAPNGKGFEKISFSTSKKLTKDGPALNRKGEKILQGYIDFLKAIGKATKSPSSKRLWDDWVQIAAAKSIFSHSHKQIAMNMIDGDMIVMPTYMPNHNDEEYSQSLRDTKTDGDPYGGYEIGKDHLTIPTTADKMTDASSRVT